MEILKTIDWNWILEKSIFVFFGYIYYKIILKFCCIYFLNDFEKKYSEKIKNQTMYFFGLFFYGLFCTLFILIVLSEGVLIFIISKAVINYYVLTAIFTSLFCLIKAFIMLDKHSKVHWL